MHPTQYSVQLMPESLALGLNPNSAVEIFTEKIPARSMKFETVGEGLNRGTG